MAPNSTLVHKFAVFLTACIAILIFAGGLVTSTGSGLSVPDWPLSYGQFFPPMIGGIRFEHSHRVIAGTVGILTLILMILTLVKESRVWVKGLSVLAFFMVVAQAVLGGLTVIYLLPKPISISHACLGQTFFCLIALISFFTSEKWRSATPVTSEQTAPLRRLLLITAFLTYLQLVLGAVVRHIGGQGIPYHLVLAFLVFLHIFLILIRIAKDPQVFALFFKTSAALIFLLFFQVCLGFGSFIYIFLLEKSAYPMTAEVLLRTAHQTNGAFLLALIFILTAKSYRLLALPAKRS